MKRFLPALAFALTLFSGSAFAQLSQVQVPSPTDGGIPISAAQMLASTSAVYAVLASGLPTYDATGAAKTPSHVVVTNCTLAVGTCTITLAGAAAYTSATTYSCSSADQSLVATLSSINQISGTSLKVYGSLTDSIRVFCIGW